MKFLDMFHKVVATKAYATPRTMEEDPLMGFMFRISISGIASTVGFQKVSGLSKEIAVVDYFENMYEHAHKLPGRESIGEITLEKGMFADKVFQTAYEEFFNSTHQRRDVTITICNRFGEVARTFSFSECWFSKYEVSDLDSSADDVIIETLTMQAESMD